MRCRATKKNGEPCTLQALGSSDFCWAHDPKHAEGRRKGQKRGGKSKPLSELAVLKQKLEDLGDDVIRGTVSQGNAAVAATCYAGAIKAVEAAVKVRELQESRLVETQLRVEEQHELMRRLEQLEETYEQERGTWGA